MKTIRLANKIIKTLVKDGIYYPNRLFVDVFGMIAHCGFLLIIYWYVFRLNGGSINNVTYVVAAWSIFFYFAFMLLDLRSISRVIMNDVQSGKVENLFNKPISYVAYRIYWQIGSGFYPFFVISLVSAMALVFFIGVPGTMLSGFFLFTLSCVFLGGIILSLFLYTVVGLLAFWIEDINPIFWIVDKFIMILGGSYLPVALFPGFMKKIAIWSPFGASQFVTHTVYESWVKEWPLKMGIQIFWIVVVFVIVSILFTKARKKVSINGG